MSELTMAIWLLVGLIAVLLGRGMLLGRLSFGLQAMAGIAGMGLMIAYVAAQGPTGLAWGAAGVAVIGVLAVITAVAGLLSDDDTASTPAAQSLELFASGLAGIQVWMFVVAGALSIATALNGAANF